MFEKIKKRIQERIEKNAVKSELTWFSTEFRKDENNKWIRDERNRRVKFGVPHTEMVLLKRSKLPILGDWARIYPILNEDGSWNIINTFFGGRRNLIKLIVILSIVGFVLLSFKDFFTGYEALKTACEPFLKMQNWGVLG